MPIPLRASHIVLVVVGTLLLAMTGVVSAQNYQVTTLATGLDKPWSIAAIDNGAFLVTEKSGRLVRLDADGAITAINDAPEVYYANQGGLLEVLPAPAFTTNRTIYLSFAGGDKSANRTTVVKATLNGDALTNKEIILEVAPDKEGACSLRG
jgi:glucose/arabinose dehydrogenase